MSLYTYMLLFCKACTQFIPYPEEGWVNESENCPWMYVFQKLNIKYINTWYNF